MEAAALKWSKGGNGLQQMWFSTIVLEVRVAMHCNIPCHAESSSVVSRRGLGIMANVGTSAARLAAGVAGRCIEVLRGGQLEKAMVAGNNVGQQL